MSLIQSRFRDAALATVLAILIVIPANPSSVAAEILCADDLVPLGMAVTATGTAPTSDGSCRAKEIKPACGLVMKICDGQPIPDGYTIDSVTRRAARVWASGARPSIMFQSDPITWLGLVIS